MDLMMSKKKRELVVVHLNTKVTLPGSISSCPSFLGMVYTQNIERTRKLWVAPTTKGVI
jgi:hypothetical protein